MTPTCVLTAAHCVVDYQPPRLSILAGTSKLRGGGGKRYFVQSIKVHPNYKELVTSDIAVMKINGTFDFKDPKIAPIKYSNQVVGGGVNLTLTGWGYTTPIRIGAPPNDLQVAVLPSITNDECQKEGMNVTETEMCTYSRLFQGACGVSEGEFNRCQVLSKRFVSQGDSGGPLALNDGEEVVGVVSYGTAICSIGRPDVYTRVSQFTDWIAENCAD